MAEVLEKDYEERRFPYEKGTAREAVRMYVHVWGWCGCGWDGADCARPA